MAKKKKGSWIVTMKCEITKEVVCENCTEEEARSDPFEYAVDENETSQEDYTVTSIRSNE